MAAQNELNDDELMILIGKGNAMAFQTLFDRYSGLGLAYGNKLLQDQPLAEDILQESWIKIVKLAQSFKGQGQFKAWFLTLIRNAAFNHLRGQKRFTELKDTDAFTSSSDVEQELINAESESLTLKKIEALPSNQRIALLLWAVEDLDYKSIAEQMDISVSSVKSLIFRARQKLASLDDET